MLFTEVLYCFGMFWEQIKCRIQSIVAPKKTTRKLPNLLVCGSAWLPQQPRPCLWHLHGGFKRPWEEVHPRKLRQLKRPQNSASASLTEHVRNDTFHRKVGYVQFFGEYWTCFFWCSFCWSAWKIPRHPLLLTLHKKQFDIWIQVYKTLSGEMTINYCKHFFSTNWMTAVAKHFQQGWLRFLRHVE